MPAQQLPRIPLPLPSTLYPRGEQASARMLAERRACTRQVFTEAGLRSRGVCCGRRLPPPSQAFPHSSPLTSLLAAGASLSPSCISWSAACILAAAEGRWRVSRAWGEAASPKRLARTARLP